MKYIATIISVALAGVFTVTGCSGGKNKASAEAEAADTVAAVTPRVQLIERLGKVRDTGKFAFGHHDDTAYGHTWRGEDGRSDVKEVTGDYPAIMNWDLGLVEWGAGKQLDGVQFELIHNEAVKQDARGGINTFSWHPRNPATKGDSWDTAGGNVVKEAVTGGSALNDTVREWIGRAADFIGSIRDAAGNRIPVVFRPWHEHTGSWFWWGGDNTDTESYRKLWHMTREVFDAKGIDNVVWAYSPDKVDTVEQYMERYPGDEYVDIMGADVYCFDGKDGLEQYAAKVKSTLSAAVSQAEARGKLAAFTETGLESITVSAWYTDVLMPLVKEFPVVYVSVWRNADNIPRHFYTPYPGHPAEESFKAFYNDSITLFAKDISEIK